METEQSNFLKLFWGTVSFSLLLIISCVAILVFIPSNPSEPNKIAVEQLSVQASIEPEIPEEKYFADLELSSRISEHYNKGDRGLMLYRQPESKAAVEWFYTHVTNNRDVALAVLKEADKNDIPVSLAFSLAHTESNYKVTAVHKNTNGSIDRGLFQLNNQTFPKLEADDFFDPKISAKYGLSHLRFCMNTAGNEIAALAMYNAGTNKVRNNGTPQVTLNYISQIEDYRSFLDETFEAEVVTFYGSSDNGLLAKK